MFLHHICSRHGTTIFTQFPPLSTTALPKLRTSLTNTAAAQRCEHIADPPRMSPLNKLTTHWAGLV
eukprot:1002717-Ditylum_brightwellii.AAC.1